MNEHSLKYNAVSALKKLRKAGVSQGQAEVHVEVISDALENVATKSDQKQMENSLVTKMDSLATRMDSLVTRMDSLVTRMDSLVTRMDLLSQQFEFLRDEFNQKMEKNFYKLLVLLPAMAVSLYALYDYLKDKLS